MRALFQRLRHQKINALDDGTVVGDTNLDELQPAAGLEAETAPSPSESEGPKAQPDDLLRK
ncbi:MAG: hypothetical protein WDO13_12055 [Verrucomicrobiota bacterium]